MKHLMDHHHRYNVIRYLAKKLPEVILHHVKDITCVNNRVIIIIIIIILVTSF